MNDLPDNKARVYAVTALIEITQGKRSADSLHNAPQYARRVITTALKNITIIDTLIAQSASHGLRAKEQYAKSILRCAVAEMKFMDQQAYGVVDSYVAISRHGARYQTGFINAVLRKISETVLSETTLPSRLPDWIKEIIVRDYGSSAVAMMEESLNSTTEYIDITCKENPQFWADTLEGIVLPTNTVRLYGVKGLTTLPGFIEGHWWVQNIAASLPVKLLEGGNLAVDLCAAPGGKTAQLAMRYKKVIAVEKSTKRAERLNENIKRLRLDNVEVVIADARIWRPATAPCAVLLDAPCTSSGLIRTKPDLAFTKSGRDAEELSKVQRELVDAAVAMLKSGGDLIYSTCSIFKAEGEDVANYITTRYNSMRLIPISPDEVGGMDNIISPHGYIRALPWHLEQHGGVDGFFTARFKAGEYTPRSSRIDVISF